MKNAMIEKKINDTEEKILDEYDLINSLSIGNYCRKIKHKFNTEELAVLVYRNKRMSIDEKISIYKNLIKNYPDMEVIKRINCKHYDSVRELISDEIKRLQDLKTNFLKQEENVVHFFNAYYESTRKWDNYIATKNNIVKTYKEIDELIAQDIKEYEDWFEEDTNADVKRKELSKEQLFKLKTIYDFTITEFDPKAVEQLKNNLPVVIDEDIHNLYCSNLTPAKIEHCFDYNGKEIYISGVYIFSYNGKKREQKVMMDYEDYINPSAGTKFKKGDIVKIKKDYDSHLGDYNFYDKLHVITDIPHKVKNQKFFRNSYGVIVNHNSFDEGCHVDVFNEKELELYTNKLPEDSPIIFLSKYFKGEIKLKNNTWRDIESGRITLNENTSFRDVPEIMKQMKGKP